MSAVVQADAFSPTLVYEALISECPGAAVATFTGYVRDFNADDSVQLLELEHYPGMAERVLVELGDSAMVRFNLRAWRIIHRYGALVVNEPIVWVAAVADHRGNAFAACEFMMDTLKTTAPFWKREHSDRGAQWLAARELDLQRGERWRDEP